MNKTGWEFQESELAQQKKKLLPSRKYSVFAKFALDLH